MRDPAPAGGTPVVTNEFQCRVFGAAPGRLVPDDDGVRGVVMHGDGLPVALQGTRNLLKFLFHSEGPGPLRHARGKSGNRERP